MFNLFKRRPVAKDRVEPGKLRAPSQAAREAVIRELLDLQTDILGVLSPGALVGLTETNYLASVAMGAIISTTPGKLPEQKTHDLTELMDVLIRAIDDTLEEETPERQAEFQSTFQERWGAYLIPVAYILGKPDDYLKLDKMVVHLLGDRMGLQPTILEGSQIEVGLQQVIRAAANRVWPALQ